MSGSPPKQKTCRVCKQDYIPRRPLQVVCGLPCAIEDSRAKRLELAKKRQAADRKAVEHARKQISAQKARAKATENAQNAVNAFIRARDHGKPCISCGALRKLTAGHHRTRASTPELRFNTKAINGQCSFCNSGHVRKFHDPTIADRYDEGVAQRYGQARVDWVKGPHEHKKYSRDDLNRIRRLFQRREKHYRRLRGIE